MASSGNVVLSVQEIKSLRTLVTSKYEELAGPLQPLHISSNPANYQPLYSSIDQKISLGSQGIKSTKPLLSLFWTNKNTEEKPIAFRKRFIDSLYQYATGLSRDEFTALTKENVDSISTRQMEMVRGLWQCYSLENDLHFRPGAIQISGETLSTAAIYFFHDNNILKGTIGINNTNFVLSFKDEKNGLPISFFMNCPGNYIHERESHVRHALGFCSFIDTSGLPRISNCFMEYHDYETLIAEFSNDDEKDFTSENFLKKFINYKRHRTHSYELNNKNGELWDESTLHKLAEYECPN